MPTVAEQLRQAREARHLTIEQVAEITKVRSDHVRALEEGNYNVFSAPVYIRGFVRTYSALLKLDVAKVIADVDAELGKTRQFSEPPPLTKQPKGALDFVTLQLSKVDWRRAIPLIGILLVIGIIGGAYWLWHHNHSQDPLKGLKPGIYQAPNKDSGDTLPLPGKR
jgi:cytoskeletal protein RodZ